jgi:hypothetical protein
MTKRGAMVGVLLVAFGVMVARADSGVRFGFGLGLGFGAPTGRCRPGASVRPRLLPVPTENSVLAASTDVAAEWRSCRHDVEGGRYKRLRAPATTAVQPQEQLTTGLSADRTLGRQNTRNRFCRPCMSLLGFGPHPALA